MHAPTPTHICPRCETRIRPVLRHGGSAAGRAGIALGLVLVAPVLGVAAGAAAAAAPALAPSAAGLTVLAMLLGLGLGLWALARLLLDLAAPRHCPACGAAGPVPAHSPRGRRVITDQARAQSSART
jgi:hypothetical protein